MLGRSARARHVLAVLVLFAAGPAAAADAPPERLDVDYLRGFVSDARDLVTAPARWDGMDWLEAGGVVGAGVGVYFGLDVPVRRAARRNAGPAANRAADAGQAFGNGLYVVPGLLLAYAGGRLSDDDKLSRAALDAGESLALASAVAATVKGLAGRERPYVSGDHAAWHGPSFTNDRFSFPSGHTTAAFSVATIFASEYGDHAWVPYLAYGLAGVAAAARVERDKHWASDVFAGGALGYFVSKSVLASRRKKAAKFAVVPWIDATGATGARVCAKF